MSRPPKVSRRSVLTLVVIVADRNCRCSPSSASSSASTPGTVLAKYTDTVAPPAGLAGAAGTATERARDCAAGQHAGIHPGADLRANDRLCEGVVPRHRLACEQGRAACGHRDAGAGPATSAGEGGPGDRAEQRRAGEDDGRPLPGSDRSERGLATGHGQRGQRN